MEQPVMADGERPDLDAVLRGLRAAGLQPVVLYDLSGEVVIVGVANDDRAVAPAPVGWDRLSDREQAVARLAGQALTNRQIARRLGISAHTVNYHLRQIFRKLAIGSRVSLAAYAKLPGTTRAKD
ncbi:helix-turn-helix transcriptional regulator [Dactylosporangium roseum]|uniref:Helix-turn-helix transcriptional regulator n=1 Tax=Dactylosporangium roseum TaxID=47989 RepID=A0ABY5Z4U9_9ACTN|nr:helix-turn-helix transcriptional regulator [Dactylosporangium roseum]UWZ37085.1 helix-turn-helix transcriptional regulator [Dactylosporangium roseum]